jgi:hypothetical protein
MSVVGQTRPLDRNRARSVDPSAADMRRLHWHVGFVPETEVTAVGVQAQLLAFMLGKTLKISECRPDTVT